MSNSDKLPKNNYLKYYSGINIITGKTILTTSINKLSKFLSITRVTVYRNMKNRSYYICSNYIISISNSIEKQDKGNYRQFKDDNSYLKELRQLAREQRQYQNDTVS